jgi:hypothetical protein
MRPNAQGPEDLVPPRYRGRGPGWFAHHGLILVFLANFLILMLLHLTVAIWASKAPDGVRSYRLPVNGRGTPLYGPRPVGLYMNRGGTATMLLWIGLGLFEVIRHRGEGKPPKKGKFDDLGG